MGPFGNYIPSDRKYIVDTMNRSDFSFFSGNVTLLDLALDHICCLRLDRKRQDHRQGFLILVYLVLLCP